MINKLEVFYSNKKVGSLFITKNKNIGFQYSKEWLADCDRFSISPFSLPLDEKIFIATKPYFNGLFGVFGDSFVDSWGELLIERYLKSKGVNYRELNVLDKLSLIGNNTMGGLLYKPYSDINICYDKIDLDSIQKDIDSILNSKEACGIDNVFKLGGSSGGTRPKILTKHNNMDVIIKFASSFDPKNIAELEYKYMSLAKEAGINIPYIELISGKENDYFLIQRFDRKTCGKRVHMISASGLLECDYKCPSLDYLDLIKLTNILTRNKNDVIEMFKRMVFNVVFDNLDDHTKNFAFIYDEDRKMYCLSPAFDITPSTTYYGEHTTSVNGKGKNITKEDMLLVAKKSSINKDVAEKIINSIYGLKNNTN